MENIIFRDCTEINNKLYFWDEDTATPMTIDLEQRECSILDISNRERYRDQFIDLTTSIDSKIYSVERSGAYMCEYSIDTRQVRYINIGCQWRADGNFALMQHEANNIFIFERKHGVTIYDTISDKVEKIPYPIAVDEVITGCKYKDEYLLFPKDGDQVFRYDVRKKKWCTNKMRTQLFRVVHAVSEQNNIYILTEDGTIIEWDMGDNWNVINVAKAFYNTDRAASRICLTKDNFVVLPSVADEILIIDKESLEMTIYKEYPQNFKYSNNTWTRYLGYCENEREYLFACRTSSYVLKISKETTELTWIPSEIDENLFFEYEQRFPVIQEKTRYLDFFIDRVCRENMEE